MKVKLLKKWLRFPKSKPGDVVELGKPDAEYWIKRGLCVAADGSAPADPQAQAAELAAVKTELADTQKKLAAAEQELAELKKGQPAAGGTVAGQEEKKPAGKSKK